MTKTELNKFKKILEAKQAELEAFVRNREGIAIEKSADALDEVQHAAERELAIRNLDRESNLLRNVRAALRRIGECCYEVGAEVAARFGKSGRSQINLALENRRQLIEVGVSERHISVEGSCTYCDADVFHSFRRQGDAAGRMISFIKRLD